MFMRAALSRSLAAVTTQARSMSESAIQPHTLVLQRASMWQTHGALNPRIRPVELDPPTVILIKPAVAL